MIFSVVYCYSDKDDQVIYRKRANVKAATPADARKKVCDFFLKSHEPTSSFHIESIKELFTVNYLII